MKYLPLVMVIFFALSCATATEYKYFIIDPVNDRLLGHEPKDDLPLTETCKATTADKAKCVALLTEEFFKMKKELLQLREDLKACQAGPVPTP